MQGAQAGFVFKHVLQGRAVFSPLQGVVVLVIGFVLDKKRRDHKKEQQGSREFNAIAGVIKKFPRKKRLAGLLSLHAKDDTAFASLDLLPQERQQLPPGSFYRDLALAYCVMLGVILFYRTRKTKVVST